MRYANNDQWVTHMAFIPSVFLDSKFDGHIGRIHLTRANDHTIIQLA